jgi:hypothetical protein
MSQTQATNTTGWDTTARSEGAFCLAPERPASSFKTFFAQLKLQKLPARFEGELESFEDTRHVQFA